MTNQNDSPSLANALPEKQSLSLDWWAVIFALALTGLVLLGLPVGW